MRQIVAALLLALPAASPSAAAPVPPGPQEVDLGAVKSSVDRALRWVRSTQDPETGAYGDGREIAGRDGHVDATALVLLAMARSHRKYREVDGPFVSRALDFLETQQREDGAFPAGAVQRDRIRVRTGLVVTALEALGETGPDTMHARATGYLGDLAPTLVAANTRSFDSLELAASTANELLATQSEDGSWPDGFLHEGPSVWRTASAVLELTAARAALAAAAGDGESTPRDARPLPPIAEVDRARVAKSTARAAAFLADEGPEGRWGALGREDAGITAMVLGALATIEDPEPDVAAAIDAGLAWLVSLQKEDGSIHDGQLANYVTSAAILALTRVGEPEHAEVVQRARAFLVRLQADEGEGYDPSHHYYGGVGYGGDERPDLSNLQMALEALSAAGLEEGDETFEKALRFLERTQNRSESNDIALEDQGAVVRSGDDGGAAYMPGDSKAGFLELADGTKVPRSYGSMTYALLKGYLFAGLEKDDPRVEAAWNWLRENYTLDVNPGFEGSSDPTAAYQGLFYYFYTMARALDLYGVDVVEDASGTPQPWRSQLTGRLLAMQRPDGSWVNENSPRWWEGNPVLATAYALLTLDAAQGDAPDTE